MVTLGFAAKKYLDFRHVSLVQVCYGDIGLVSAVVGVCKVAIVCFLRSTL